MINEEADMGYWMLGDTIGGIGSALAIKRGSFARKSDGTYTGTFIAQPDRGFNM